MKRFWPDLLKKTPAYFILVLCEFIPRINGGLCVKDFYKAMENLIWVTQLGLSLLLPPVFFLGLAHWLVTRWGWPVWVWLPAILLGLATAAVTFRSFAARWLRDSRRDAEHRPSGFNRH